jgi:molecular chaperone DnaK (HSP70)
VAMGTATHAAMISGQVPLYEIISALTLDTLPHTIGILTVDNTKNTSTACDLKRLHQFEHHFIPILMKNSPLPSSNYKTFELADPYQKGITVHVVEYVGGGVGLHEYEHVGEFTFLLHKLSSTNRREALNSNIKRTVDVAISVDRDGNLNVSIFDWNDPEHLMKLRRYLSRKEEDSEIDELVYQQLVGNRIGEITQEQMLLILSCFILIALYVFVKLLFSSEGTRSHNEL